MTSYFDATANRILVVQNDHIVFDTDRKSVNLVPSGAFYLSGVGISFPDLDKANGYMYNHSTGFATSVCDSFITLLPQEWGPGRAHNLDYTYLGSIPSACDYLDVRVKITSRDVNPSQVLGVDIKVIPPIGEWINCPGGSCPLEFTTWARGFEVVRSGADIYMARYQTVKDAGVTVPWRSDNAEHLGGGGDADGWTHGAAGSQAAASVGAVSEKGIIVSHRESKNTSGSIEKTRTDTNHCTIDDNTNYGAHYYADMLITPGKYTHV